MKKLNLLFFVCIIFHFSSTFLFAAFTGKISGKITDSKTGEALIGANVFLVSTNLGASSNADGNFLILQVPPGLYDLKISMVGYKTVILKEVRVKSDQTTEINFELETEVIEGQEVIIIAEKPKVEKDLTATKQSLDKDQIENSWAGELKDLISDLPGTNINGGIRGGFGLDVAYKLDGLDMRDVGSNSNFSLINLSTVQAVEVLTGGWNAEYGQANGAIVNVVSRQARDRMHIIFQYRTRPPGKYHWGRAFFDDQSIYRGIMTTPAFWDPQSTWQTEWMTTPLPGYDGGRAPYTSMTPEQRAAYWTAFINDEERFPFMKYIERREWESELTLYGPINEKLGYLVSARYKDGVTKFPSSLPYNADYTIQTSLNYDLTTATKINLTGIFTYFYNAGPPKTYFQSSEETIGAFVTQELPYIRNPYTTSLLWLYGSKDNSDQFTIRPPEKADFFNLQAKVTQILSNSSFFDVAVQHSRMQYRMDYRDIAKSAFFESYGLPTKELLDDTRDTVYVPGWHEGYYGQTPPKSFIDFRWGYPGDTWKNWIDTRNTTIKADYVNQINKNHQIKTGLIFSLQMYDKLLHEGGTGGYGVQARAAVNDMIDTKTNPYEGSFYLQDKMEYEGLIINAGLRVDYFNPNRTVAADFFDPLLLGAQYSSDGTTIGRVNFNPDGGPNYVKTSTKWALSPRIGISHPISENIVLHFMAGKFNQRPSWQKLLANPVVWATPLPEGLDSELKLPDTTIVAYRSYSQRVGNPALTWETMTQYELGFQQNIENLLNLDVTLYYKKAHNLTNQGGLSQGPSDTQLQSNSGGIDVWIRGDPKDPSGINPGKSIGDFVTIVNGGYSDVRGLETVLETRFRHINASLSYTLSYLNVGRSYYQFIYKEFETGRLQDNVYRGANNSDTGENGTDDQNWNPHSTAVLKLFVTSPDDFGPDVLGHILGGWVISTTTAWAQGQDYTYYSPDYTSVRTPYNMTWKDRWNTNMSVSKSFDVYGDVKLKFFVQVYNLFNNQHLRLLSGNSLTEYMENGTLPFNSTTREPLEWTWYTNLPREIHFGVNAEF